jgi:glucose-6-phosphate isomerase
LEANPPPPVRKRSGSVAPVPEKLYGRHAVEVIRVVPRHDIVLDVAARAIERAASGICHGGIDVVRLHVLDTTHPAAVRRIADGFDLERTLFVAASKSGTTLETRSHLELFWERIGQGEAFVAITDPGSELETVARERSFRAVVPGEPTIGGRYSALSAFGLVPAALMDVDLSRFLLRVEEMVEACRLVEGNPGLELGEAFGRGWEDGRDKILINPNPGGFGVWAEQLLAESTGKQGKGLVPVPGETREGDDRQRAEGRSSASTPSTSPTSRRRRTGRTTYWRAASSA